MSELPVRLQILLGVLWLMLLFWGGGGLGEILCAYSLAVTDIVALLLSHCCG